MEQKKGVVMQKIAAFFDWDGTLSYDGRTVSPATAEAVRTLRGRGNPVFLCTGRSTGFIPEEAWAFFLEDGQICILEGEHGMYRVGGGEVARFASWPAIAAPGEFSRRFPDEAVSKLTLHGRMSPAADICGSWSASLHALKTPTSAPRRRGCASTPRISLPG